MNEKLLITTISLFFSCNLLARTNLIYMGGGGEGNKVNTIFDENIVDMQQVLQTKKWDYKVSFNGGHPQTEAALKKSFPNSPNLPFTAKNYLKMIEDLKTRIKNNQIKPNEQVLLFIDSHGAEKGNDKTHSISIANNKSITNYNNLGGTSLVSIDKIQEIIDLSEAKNIKLGIVDLSCHSGNTLNLRKNSAKTCIVTSTGPQHYAFAGNNSFGNEFINQLKSGTHTLESAFLEARRISNDNAYPMISTSQSERTRKSIYELITPYLQYQGKNIGKLKDDIIDMATLCYECRANELTRLIKHIETFKKIGAINDSNSRDMIANLKEYEALRKFLTDEYKKLNDPIIKNKEVFTSKEINPATKKPYYQLSFSWKELLKTDEAKLSKMTTVLLSKAQKIKMPDLENHKKATLNLQASILRKKKEILTKNPGLLFAETRFNGIVLKTKDTFTLANKIAQLERKIYNDIYKHSTNDKNNACGKIYL